MLKLARMRLTGKKRAAVGMRERLQRGESAEV